MAILDLSTYKTYKSMNSDVDSAQYTLLIDAVNAFIEDYCGRVFTTYFSTDNTEYFNLTETELYPVEHPIQSITSLEYSSDAGETYANTLVEYTDYVIDSSSESIIALKSVFATETYPINAIKLVYQGGYSDIPKDLELAAVHLTDFYKNEEYTPRKSLAGASVDHVIQPDRTARLPPHIRRVLENYRNIVI